MERTAASPAAIDREFDEAAIHEVVRAKDVMEADARSIATKLGYALPGGQVDPDLIQRDIAVNMRRSVESVLEIGRGLMVLKASVGHGNFTARLNELDIEDRLAQRFMAAAIKFSNASTSTHVVNAIGTQSKLFELLVLDDDQMDELMTDGQVGDLKLDKIATMTTRELRKTLREVQANYEQRGKMLANKDEAINRIIESRKLPEPTPDNRKTTLIADIASAEANARAWIIGQLQAAMLELLEHDAETGDNHGPVLAGFFDSLTHAINTVRERLGLPEPAVAAEEEFDEEAFNRRMAARGPVPFDAEGRFIPREG